MAFRVRPAILSSVFLILLLAGCNPGQANTSQHSQTQILSSQPLGLHDWPAIKRGIAASLKLTASNEDALRLMTQLNSGPISYVLYNYPNHEGLAIATKKRDAITILEPMLPVYKKGAEMVSFNTITPGNPWDPNNGVIYGVVRNSYITGVQVQYRDATIVNQDVSHTRGFIMVRPNTDPRFVLVNAFGRGGLWWSRDLR